MGPLLLFFGGVGLVMALLSWSNACDFTSWTAKAAGKMLAALILVAALGSLLEGWAHTRKILPMPWDRRPFVEAQQFDEDEDSLSY